MIDHVASDEVLDLAFKWLCKSRANANHNSDVWFLRSRWGEIKPHLQATLRAGEYRLSATERKCFDGKVVEVWSARDAIVLKSVAIVLGQELELSKRCFHLAGRGGTQAAIGEVTKAVSENRFVFRTDVKKYYASIDHQCLLERVRRIIADDFVFSLIEQYVCHIVYDGGYFKEVNKGICLGCSLSPLMGAIYLQEIDEAMEESGLFYVRYMDDWVVIAPTRWKLRDAVRRVNKIMNVLKVEQHPDKTFIGSIERGFDFLGFRFAPGGVRAAQVTIVRFVERVSQLYEQGAKSFRIGAYALRWRKWLRDNLISTTELSQSESGNTKQRPHSQGCWLRDCTSAASSGMRNREVVFSAHAQRCALAYAEV